MENNWKTISFDQICDITRGASPRPIQEHLVDNGTPWVKIADATKSPSRYITDTKEFIKPESEKNSRIVYPGELIVSNSATPALPRFLKIRACVHDGWLILRNIRNVCPEFLYYKIEKEREALLMKGNGAIFTNLKTEILKEHEIQLPPLPEQKAIASVLSSLDDKIDLLHQQNQTLEALAETLFRQWFVEEAKEDWEEIRIGDLDIYISDYVANGSFASLKDNVKLINDGVGYALFIRNTDLKSDFNQKVYVDEHSYNFLSKTKLYGGEIIISNVADVGSVHICPNFDIPMTLGNNVIMLKSEYNYFLYLFFNSNVGQDLMYGITSGSVQQKFNKTDFKNIKITIKDKNQLIDFHNYVSIYFDKIESNKQQIKTLTKLRDTLLPKLMSGEVRVKL